MKRRLTAILGATLAIAVSAPRAAEFPVHGIDGSGPVGGRAFIELVYEYGSRFSVIVEDFELQYPGDVLTLVPDYSTIDLFGMTRSLSEHVGTLSQFASAHQGSVVETPVVVLPNARKGYFYSFFVSDAEAQIRNGQVRLRMAFDVSPTAMPGDYSVSFTGRNVLVDEVENEFSFPAALRNLTVSVVSAVPEPHRALLLLIGLACVAGGAFRCAGVARCSKRPLAAAR